MVSLQSLAVPKLFAKAVSKVDDLDLGPPRLRYFYAAQGRYVMSWLKS